MSWNLRSYYTCVTLSGVSSNTALDDLLAKFASSLPPVLLEDIPDDLWDAFDDQRDDIFGDDPIPAMVTRIRGFFIQIEYENHSASVVILSDYDNEHDCNEIVNALARFLLPYADEPYLLLSLASYDNGGGYAHQSICRRSGDQVVIESVPKLLERLFAAPPHVITSLLDAVVA